MIRLYLDDEGEDRRLIAALERAGFDVLAAFDAGMRARPDAEHLAFAASEGRVLVTGNVRDYQPLHWRFVTSGPAHSGVIIAVQTLPIGEKLRRIERLAASLSAEEMQNRIEFLGAWGGEE